MHINLETDYAVRIVFTLAKCGGRVDARTISELTSVTPRFSLKILHKLTSGGLVKSYKGARGGYELAREPGEITLREVVELIEGPIVLSRCLCPEYACDSMEKKEFCYFYNVYNEISEITVQKMNNVNFGAAVRETEKKKSPDNPDFSRIV